MVKFWKTLNLIVLGLLLVICGLGTFYKHISFGLGLSDMFMYFVLYIGTITHLALTIIYRKKSAKRHMVLTFFFLIFAIFIALEATIWRGSEYKWNGSIFYLPCSTEIKIQNQGIEKDLLVQMCALEYYSELTGIWDGRYLAIKTGSIKVPKGLEEYITKPIYKIELEADTYEHFEHEKVMNIIDFDSDTLKMNEEYIISGEISGVRNSIPVMKVKIKQ